MTDKHLVVLLEGHAAGTLIQDSHHLIFEYDERYRSQTDPTPLSLSIPLAVSRHTGSGLTNGLWGLLPDNNRVLERWAVKFVRPERVDELAVVVPPHVADDSWIASRLRAVRSDSAAWYAVDEGGSGGQWSLAGAQPKFALAKDGQRWVRPAGMVPTTHIFEPNTSDFADFHINEYLCIGAAANLGLPSAFEEVLQFDDELVLVVERYDRDTHNVRIQ